MQEVENPYERIYHQLLHDIQEIEGDAGLVQNPESLVLLRNLLREKRILIMELHRKYVAPQEERG